MKNFLIINEQHSLFVAQENILREKFPEGYETIKVPATGWTLEEMKEVASGFDLYTDRVVFASPVPYLLAKLSARAGELAGQLVGQVTDEHRGVWVFHNDRRKKKELPNGKVISVTAEKGWVLA